MQSLLFQEEYHYNPQHHALWMFLLQIFSEIVHLEVAWKYTRLLLLNANNAQLPRHIYHRKKWTLRREFPYVQNLVLVYIPPVMIMMLISAAPSHMSSSSAAIFSSYSSPISFLVLMNMLENVFVMKFLEIYE